MGIWLREQKIKIPLQAGPVLLARTEGVRDVD